MRTELEKQVARSMFTRRPKLSTTAQQRIATPPSPILQREVSRLLGSADVALPPSLQAEWMRTAREQMVETVGDLAFLAPDRKALACLLASGPHESVQVDALWMALEAAMQSQIEKGESPKPAPVGMVALPRVATLSHPSHRRTAARKSWIDHQREAEPFSTRTPKFAGPRKTARGLDHQVISPTRRRQGCARSVSKESSSTTPSRGMGSASSTSARPASPTCSEISTGPSVTSLPSAFSMAASFATHPEQPTPATNLTTAHTCRASSAPRTVQRLQAPGTPRRISSRSSTPLNRSRQQHSSGHKEDNARTELSYGCVAI